MLIYLASPYTVKDPKATVQAMKNRRTRRFEKVCRKAAELMMIPGNKVFCPIAHSHSIEVNGMGVLMEAAFWLEQDFAILTYVDKLVVYRMEGWKESEGIKKEIEFATGLKIPIEYID